PSILPLYFSDENPIIGEDPNFPTGRPFAQANRVDVSAALWPLLHKDVQISSLELKQPKIELVRNAQGVWNYASLGRSSQPAAPAQIPVQRAPQPQTQPSTSSSGQPAGQTAEGQTGSSSQAFSLQDLKITDGQMAFTDYQ